MKKIASVLFFAGSVMLASALAGCSDDGSPAPKPSDPPSPTYYGGSSWSNDHGSRDYGNWPRWKNPCPGPFCDPPPDFHPEWVVDPPPDYAYDPQRVINPPVPVTGQPNAPSENNEANSR